MSRFVNKFINKFNNGLIYKVIKYAHELDYFVIGLNIYMIKDYLNSVRNFNQYRFVKTV